MAHESKVPPNPLNVLLERDTWSDNPFPRLHDRISKKGTPSHVRLLGWLLALTLVCVGALYLTWGCRLAPWAQDVFGDGAGVAAAATAWCHCVAAFVERRRQTPWWFEDEARKGRLGPLLMLPDHTTKLVARVAAVPWLNTLRVAVVGLPLYALLVAFGGMSWREVGGLYLLLALYGLAVPNCRFLLRAWANTKLPVVKPSAVMAVASWFVCVVFPCVFLPHVFSGRGLPSQIVYQALGGYVPHSLTPLLALPIATWPLFVARLMFTPLDWYGWHVAPAPFIVLDLLCTRAIQLLATTTMLDAEALEDYDNVPAYKLLERLHNARGVARYLIWPGFLWAFGVRDGHFALPAWHAYSPTTNGLTGFLLGFLWLALWRLSRNASYNAGAASIEFRGRYTGTPYTHWVLWKYWGKEWLKTVSCFVAACLIARTSPWVRSVGEMLAIMAAITAGCLIFTYEIGRRDPRFGYIGIIALLVALFGPAELRLVGLFSAPLGVLHVAGLDAWLASFCRWAGPYAPHVPAPSDAWWRWPLAASAVGLWCYAANRSAETSEQLETAAVGEPEAGEAPPPAAASPDNAAAAGQEQSEQEPLDGTDTPPTPAPRPHGSPLRAWARALAQRLTDNPVGLREYRLQATRINGAMFLIDGIAIGVFLLCSQLLPLLDTTFGGGYGRLFFGVADQGGAPEIAASTVGAACMLLICGAACAGGEIGHRLLAPEWQRSSLPFLLLTPLTEREILLGKATAAAAGNAGFPLMAALGAAFVSLRFAGVLGPVAVLWALLGTFVLSAFALCAAASLAMAQAARSPRENGSGSGAAVAFVLFVSLSLAGWILTDTAQSPAHALHFSPWAMLVAPAALAITTAASYASAMHGMRRMRGEGERRQEREERARA